MLLQYICLSYNEGNLDYKISLKLTKI